MAHWLMTKLLWPLNVIFWTLDLPLVNPEAPVDSQYEPFLSLNVCLVQMPNYFNLVPGKFINVSLWTLSGPLNPKCPLVKSLKGYISTSVHEQMLKPCIYFYPLQPKLCIITWTSHLRSHSGLQSTQTQNINPSRAEAGLSAPLNLACKMLLLVHVCQWTSVMRATRAWFLPYLPLSSISSLFTRYSPLTCRAGRRGSSLWGEEGG